MPPLHRMSPASLDTNAMLEISNYGFSDRFNRSRIWFAMERRWGKFRLNNNLRAALTE
jgi:hypothetical protein